MRAIFTETLHDFLQDNENTTEWQAIKALFDKMPQWDLNITDDSDNHTEDNINFYDMFKTMYLLREIGCEDEQYFYTETKRKINIVLIEYKAKIETFKAQFNDLMYPLVSLEETITDDGSSTNKIYINPVNASSTKLSDMAETSAGNTRTRDYQQQMTYNDTKTKIIAEFLELKNIYLVALEAFNDLFMLVY
jgi:hypothetical protein